MKVYGVSAYDVDTVVTEVSHRLYGGNLVLKSLANESNSKGPRARFTLRVLDSRAGQPGAIGGPGRTGTGPKGMGRRVGACWHAHWDVIEELLKRYPEARVTSGFRLRGVSVNYTAATFRTTALATAHLNVGTAYEPVTMPQCCECDHSRYATEPAVAQAGLRDKPGAAVAVAGTEYTGRYSEYSDGGWEYTDAPDEGEDWARGDEVGAADTSVPYLGGLPAAQPWTKPDPTDVLARIDAVLGDAS